MAKAKEIYEALLTLFPKDFYLCDSLGLREETITLDESTLNKCYAVIDSNGCFTPNTFLEMSLDNMGIKNGDLLNCWEEAYFCAFNQSKDRIRELEKENQSLRGELKKWQR